MSLDSPFETRQPAMESPEITIDISIFIHLRKTAPLYPLAGFPQCLLWFPRILESDQPHLKQRYLSAWCWCQMGMGEMNETYEENKKWSNFLLVSIFSDVVSRWCGIKCVEMNLLKTIPTHCWGLWNDFSGHRITTRNEKTNTITENIQEKHPKTSNNTKSLLNLLIFFSKRPGICFPINRPERFKPSSSEKSGKSDNNCPRKSHSPKPATFHGSWLWTVGMVAWWVGYTKTVMEKEPFPTGKTSRVKNLFILACWFTSL